MSAVAIPETEQFPPTIASGVAEAVENTLASICGEKPTQIQRSDLPELCTGMVGVISFLGNVSWTFSLALPKDSAEALAAKFAGFEIPFDSPDMGDMVGEFANVIAGDIVAQLDRRKIKAQMSLPMVVRGSEVEMLSSQETPAHHLYYQSPQGIFWVKLTTARPGHLVGRRPGT